MMRQSRDSWWGRLYPDTAHHRRGAGVGKRNADTLALPHRSSGAVPQAF